MAPSERDKIGEYLVVREIGRGGMGVVYETVQEPLSRRAALKLLPPAVSHHPRAEARFEREARAVGKLNDPNVVAVYGTGETPQGRYLAMEYVQGQSLDRIIGELAQPATRIVPEANVFAPVESIVSPTSATIIRELPEIASTDEEATRQDEASVQEAESQLDLVYFRKTAHWIAQAADGLDHAHRNGIVHRDVKPSNLFLSDQGQIKVGDFGLARDADLLTMTTPGELLGTPVYMSPEQAVAGRTPVDHRTDIYSLGVTHYHLATLRIPYQGRTRQALLTQIVSEDPVPPGRLVRRLPRDLETVILKAMAKAPDERYQTARELGDDLRRWLRGEPIWARPPTLSDRLTKLVKRNRVASVVVAAALAAFVGLAVFRHFSVRTQWRRAEGARRRAETEQARADDAWRQEAAAHQEAQAKSHQLATQLDKAYWQAYQKFAKRRDPAGRLLVAATAREHAEKTNVDSPRPWAELARHALTRCPRLAGYVTACPDPRGVDFSPDGTLVAAGGTDGAVRLWDVPTGQERAVLKGHEGTIYCVDFSPDGASLASGSGDRTVKVWDVAAGREKMSLEGHEDRVKCVQFSPDGARLASAFGRNQVKLWDAEKGALLGHTFHSKTKHILSLCFNLNGAVLATGLAEGYIFEVHVEDSSRKTGVFERSGAVWCVRYHPNDKMLASGHRDATVRLWDVGQALEKATLRGHSLAVRTLCFSPNGAWLASGSDDQTVKLWDLAPSRDGVQPAPFATIRGHCGPVRSVAVDASGATLVSASKDNTVRFWDLSASRPERPLRARTGPITVDHAVRVTGSRLAHFDVEPTAVPPNPVPGLMSWRDANPNRWIPGARRGEAEALYRLAQILERQDRIGEARELYEEAADATDVAQQEWVDKARHRLSHVPSLQPRPAPPKPGETRVNPVDGVEMVWIPGGRFLMGANLAESGRVFAKLGWSKRAVVRRTHETPRHTVHIDGFWMYRHEVTVRQFQRFVDATGYKTDVEKQGWAKVYVLARPEWQEVKGVSWRHPFAKDRPAEPDHPVVQVSWRDAQAYCEWAGMRLPTEAEWEYAARGGATGLDGRPHYTFAWGNAAPAEPVGNCTDQSFLEQFPIKYGVQFPGYDDGCVFTAPVGTYPANPLGLYDLAGNAGEWCADWYDARYYAFSPMRNPKGPTNGHYRVLRGGGWKTDPRYFTVAARLRSDAALSCFGFRCVKSH